MKYISFDHIGSKFRLTESMRESGINAGECLYLVAIPKRMDPFKATEGIFTWETGGSATITINVSIIEPWKKEHDVHALGNKTSAKMTLRECIAMEALAGLLSNIDPNSTLKGLAKDAVAAADELLKSLSSPS